MSPWAQFFLTEGIKILIARLNDSGKYDTMTEAEAKAEVAKLTGALPTTLPSPEDLEK